MAGVVVAGRPRLLVEAIRELIRDEPDLEVVEPEMPHDVLVAVGRSAGEARNMARAAGVPSVEVTPDSCDMAGVLDAVRREHVEEPLVADLASPDHHFRRLSTREVQVLRLIADGMTESEISARLGITPRTVSAHKRRTFAKLGVQTQAQAVLGALQDGVVLTGPAVT